MVTKQIERINNAAAEISEEDLAAVITVMKKDGTIKTAWSGSAINTAFLGAMAYHHLMSEIKLDKGEH